MHQPSPHARFAVTGDDLVVFNTVADRYLGLPGAIVPHGSPVALAGRVVLMDADALDGLVDMGFLQVSDRKPASEIVVPTTTVQRTEQRVGVATTVIDLFDLIIAGVVTASRMIRGRPCRSHSAERPSQVLLANGHVMQDYLARLDRLRLFLPTPRRCLPSALMTSCWLRRKGVEAQIVFGIRTHPFEAHCWTEHAGIVFDDELDRIRTFTPISIGLP